MDKINITGTLLRDMFLTGAALLEKNKSGIDALNVFPVPDGDTGTNMSLTMQSAVREMKACDSERVCDVASAVSLGALKGARGNSGVILSQIFRGFAKALAEQDEMDSGTLALALSTGTDAAYKAVMRPQEGTMLTVSRSMAESATQMWQDGANVYKILDAMLESGEDTLRRTPDMLPVLKEAGVVDSGGKGLLTIFRGFKMAMDGEELDDYMEAAEPAAQSSMQEGELGLEDASEIRFGYCTEFFIHHLDESFCESDLEHFRDKLQRIGDSVVVANDADFIKVHVHSNAPGKILQLALRLGELDKVKIDNMREQNRALRAELKKSEKECAMIAVSLGAGIDTVFKDLGVAVTIPGGQTMNPSIEDIQKAIRKANARTVFVLPNNGNVILAAQQAATLSASCSVVVIPTKTVMQGLSAAMAFLPDASEKENVKAMKQAMKNVLSGSVTYAVRDTSFNGTSIKEGDIIGMLDGLILEVGENVAEVAQKLLARMLKKKTEDPVVTVFYGEGMEQPEAEALIAAAEKETPDAEFALQYGGQPLYYYYFSVE